MEEDQPQPEAQSSRSSSIIRFAVIAFILVVLLVAGIYFIKQAMVNMSQEQKKAPSSVVREEKSQPKPADKKVADKNAASKQEAAKKEEATKNDAKKRETQPKPSSNTPAATSTPIPAASAPAPAANNTSPATSASEPIASTGPSQPLPSTGPAEVILITLGITALAYGGVAYLRSKRELKNLKS